MVYLPRISVGYGPDGRLFVGERNKEELTKGATNRLWRQARVAVFTSGVSASLLALTPYDLRQAAVSTQLNRECRLLRRPTGLGSR